MQEYSWNASALSRTRLGVPRIQDQGDQRTRRTKGVVNMRAKHAIIAFLAWAGIELLQQLVAYGEELLIAKLWKAFVAWLQGSNQQRGYGAA